MKEIKLTQGKVALVDDEDFEYLNQWKWYANKNNRCFYAVRGIKKDNKWTLEAMHRIILNTPNNMVCDHINHDGLDNRRRNLRNCTKSENGMNRVPTGKVKYLGVNKKWKGGGYSAKISVLGIHYCLGNYKHDWAAALAYDIAAKKYHGEFANLNFK